MNYGRVIRFFRSRWLWLSGLVLLAILPQAYAWREFQKAKSLSESDQLEEATMRLSRCRSIWPWAEKTEVCILASRLARQRGDLQTAIHELRLAKKNNGDVNSDIAFEWALTQASDGNVSDIAEFLQQRVSNDPTNQRLVWEAMAEGFLAVYRANDAYTIAQQWATKFPDDLKGLELRGRAAIQGRGRGLKLGVEDFRKVLAKEPKRSRVRHYLAITLLELGLFSEAIPEFEQLVSAEPENLDHQVRLARCFNMSSRSSEANRLIDEVLRKNPDQGMALRTRGQFALSEARHADAEKWLKKAADSLPNDYQTQFLYYQALVGNGNQLLAETQLQKAESVRKQTIQLSELKTQRLAARPFDPALYVELGEILIRTGHADQGLRWLNEALALDPNNRNAHATLAEYYERSGKTELAAPHRQKANIAP